MPPSESEILAARLSRMKGLIDALEQASAASADQRELFLKLQREMTAARTALKICHPPGFE
jgi:hypothetical protein